MAFIHLVIMPSFPHEPSFTNKMKDALQDHNHPMFIFEHLEHTTLMFISHYCCPKCNYTSLFKFHISLDNLHERINGIYHIFNNTNLILQVHIHSPHGILRGTCLFLIGYRESDSIHYLHEVIFHFDQDMHRSVGILSMGAYRA